MGNIKDKITNYLAIILAVVGGLQTYLQLHAGQPINWAQLSLFIAGIVISYFTGKTPDGSTKTPEQVTQQNAPK